MLHLHFGNRLEPLADALAAELDRAWRDPLDPPSVVVPSPSVGQWLKRRLASRGRTLLHPSTTTLESFLWRCLDPGPEDRILRVEALQHAVARCLEPAILDRPEFAEPARYLRRPDGSTDPVRRVQLSREMARLFLEYEYNRPSVWGGTGWIRDGVDRSWPDRPWFGGTSDAPGEGWQRILHGAVFAPGGPLFGTGWLGLPRLHRLRRERGRQDPAPPAFLLSVDKTSHFHRNLLLELSRSGEIHLFLVNPCMEFWEDVDTSRRAVRKARRPLPFRRLEGEEYLSAEIPSGFWRPEDDPRLLRLWGRTARENTVLWSQAADHDFEDHSSDPTTGADAGLLHSVQSCLLRRDPGPLLRTEAGPPVPDDGSLRILAAPEPLREWEAVRDAVFQWLSEDPSRRPSDAVVLLPDPSSRIQEIEAVFGASAPDDPGRIPWSVVGARGGSSAWAAGARLLLETWREGLDRRRVLSLARNPLVRRRRNLTESDISSWARWMGGAGILSGWDLADRAHHGESARLASDAHTFRAGLLRLSAAAFSDEPVSLGLEGGLGSGTPPWRDRDASDPDALDPFLSFCEDLHRDLDPAPSGSLSALGRRFLSLCDAWLDPTGDPVEETVRREVAEGIESFDLRGPGDVDPAELVESLATLLDGELPGSSSAFGGALTFAPLRPGQILPHGLVVVAGLDESFPGEARNGSLDLVSRHRILGDADPVADNRHAFLLALLSARDRFVATWTAHDLRKDVERPPSPVVLELEAALREGFLGGDPGAVPLRRAVPLLARAGGILEGDPPAWEVPSWDPSDATESVQNAERHPAAPPAGEPDLDDLRAFLESPFLSRVRGGILRDEDDERETASPLVPPVPRLHDLCSRIVDGIWGGSTDPDALVDDVLGRAAWEEGVPERGFLEGFRGSLLGWARSIARGVADLPDRRTGREVADLLPAPCPPSRRAPRGIVRWASVPGPSEIVLADLARFSGSRPLPARKARLYLAGAALRAGGARSVRLLWLERMGEGRVESEPLPERADPQWLRALELDFADPARTEHLPLSVLAGKAASRREIEEAFHDDRRFRDELERLLEPSLPDLPESDILAIADRLFAPWRLG